MTTCTCQGGHDQPEGAQLRANDCPIHGLDDHVGDDDLGCEAYAQMRVGAKVIEMCDLVKVADASAPGAIATWGLVIDDIRYEVTVGVGQQHAETVRHVHDTIGDSDGDDGA